MGAVKNHYHDEICGAPEVLIDLLALALPYVEEAANDPCHKPGPVRDLANRIRRQVSTPKDQGGAE